MNTIFGSRIIGSFLDGSMLKNENYLEWAENNSMNFNSLKFAVLRYGSNEEIKLNTIYFF